MGKDEIFRMILIYVTIATETGLSAQNDNSLEEVFNSISFDKKIVECATKKIFYSFSRKMLLILKNLSNKKICSI